MKKAATPPPMPAADVSIPPECQACIDDFRAYAEGSLTMKQAKAVDAHLAACQACAQDFEESQKLYQIMDNTLGARALASDFDQKAEATLKQTSSDPRAVQQELDAAPAAAGAEDEDMVLAAVGAEDRPNPILAAFAGAPWWGVSVLLHGLVIALAGLISMAVKLPPPEESVITVTELFQRPKIDIEPEKKKDQNDSPLITKHDTPPTDPTAKEFSDIIVPPDILAKAELGDHFETINPDRPDTQSAFGNPDAKIFHSVQGNDEPAGGGGDGGAGLEESLIGVGGKSSAGTGGGWGGGNGTGIGTGDGSGRGSFGNRNGGGRRLMVMRHKGSKASEDAVDRGLEWLARNQEADGRWDCMKHGGKGKHDAAMTGFALLAFLGAGHTEKVGKYKDVVKKGVGWLIGNMNDKGGWSHSCYENGIATMALGEAAGMARIKETKEAAQKAINQVDDAQRQTDGTSDREAWDYGRRGNTNDSSVMAWNILALKSCKVAGLSVNHQAFEGCLNWINAGQELGNFKPGDVTYDYEGGMMSYRGTVANPNKGKGSMAVTAAAGLCRLMIGGAKGDDPGVAGPCNLILKKNLCPKTYPMNMYFGYYATLLMFQKGGEHWKAWNEGMKVALPAGQVKGGNDDGSWDPTGAASFDCRVMSTALCILCMEVYYRYAKLQPDQ